MKDMQELEDITFKPVLTTNPKNRSYRDPSVKAEDLLIFQGKLA